MRAFRLRPGRAFLLLLCCAVLQRGNAFQQPSLVPLFSTTHPNGRHSVFAPAIRNGLQQQQPQRQEFIHRAYSVSQTKWSSTNKCRIYSRQQQSQFSISLGATAAISTPNLAEYDSVNEKNSIDDDGNNNNVLFEKLGVGVLRDWKARWPFLRSDVTDGLNLQCLAATMFLFFACLAPAVGFGGLYGTATNGAMGTVEMVSSTALSGIIYAMCATQPVTIIGGKSLEVAGMIQQEQKRWANWHSVTVANDLFRLHSL